MPSPFDNIQFASYEPTYVGLPIDAFIKSATELNNRYEQASAAKDQLDVLASNFKVDDPNTVHVKNRIDAIRNQFSDVVKTGAFEHAMPTVKQAFKDLSMDKALSTSLQHYTQNRQTEQQLFEAYTAGGRGSNQLLDKEQYQDRIAQLKQYKGIGDPIDDLGNYDENPFTYDKLLGAKYVDLNEVAREALTNYSGGDVMDVTQSGLGYSDNATYSAEQMAMLGQPSSRTTVRKTSVDGLEAASIVESGIRNNPDAMAYIADKVRIYNQNNPNNPIDANQMIARYREDALRKEGKNTTQVQVDELGTNIADARIKSKKRTGEDGTELPESAIFFNVEAQQDSKQEGKSLNNALGTKAGQFFTNVMDFAGGVADVLVGGSAYTVGAAIQHLNPYIGLTTPTNPILDYGERTARQGYNRMADWHTKTTYAKSNYNQLSDVEKDKANTLIYLHGSPETIEAMQKVNNDFSKLPEPIVKRFLEDPTVKENYNKTSMSSNMYATAHTYSGTQIKNTLFKGSTLDEIANNNPAVAHMPVYNLTTGTPYENMAEYRKDVGTGNNPIKGLGNMKIADVAESGVMNNLYGITGDSKFLYNMIVQVGDHTLAFGVGPTELDGGLNPSFDSRDKRLTNEYKLRSYVTLNYNKAIAQAPNMPINEQIKRGVKPTLLANPFYRGQNNYLGIQAYTETISVPQEGGNRNVHRFRLTDPISGITVTSGQTVEYNVPDGKGGMQTVSEPLGDSFDEVFNALIDLSYLKYKNSPNNPYIPSSSMHIQE